MPSAGNSPWAASYRTLADQHKREKGSKVESGELPLSSLTNTGVLCSRCGLGGSPCHKEDVCGLSGWLRRRRFEIAHRNTCSTAGPPHRIDSPPRRSVYGKTTSMWITILFSSCGGCRALSTPVGIRRSHGAAPSSSELIRDEMPCALIWSPTTVIAPSRTPSYVTIRPLDLIGCTGSSLGYLNPGHRSLIEGHIMHTDSSKG